MKGLSPLSLSRSNPQWSPTAFKSSPLSQARHLKCSIICHLSTSLAWLLTVLTSWTPVLHPNLPVCSSPLDSTPLRLCKYSFTCLLEKTCVPFLRRLIYQPFKRLAIVPLYSIYTCIIQLNTLPCSYSLNTHL